MIHKVWVDGLMRHPLAADLPCPVLQYADDILILCQTDTSAVSHLKRVLDDFATSTGLSINFHKFCFIPMHVSPDNA
jgi:hypothetical protein